MRRHINYIVSAFSVFHQIASNVFCFSSYHCCVFFYFIQKVHKQSLCLWHGFYVAVYIALNICIVLILSFSHLEQFVGEINLFKNTDGSC